MCLLAPTLVSPSPLVTEEDATPLANVVAAHLLSRCNPSFLTDHKDEMVARNTERRWIRLENPKSLRRKGIYPKPEMHVGGKDQGALHGYIYIFVRSESPQTNRLRAIHLRVVIVRGLD